MDNSLAELDARVAGCRACPRLVDWREEVARTKRAAFAEWTYWGRPVPGFGPPDAPLLVIGLAPAAHGGNRTGRMFTGDRSGDVLYAALHEVGLASQPTSVSVDDGLALYGVRVTSPVHCAPPANKPTPEERDTCRPWLVSELKLLKPTLRAVVVLGAFGWQAALPAFAEAGWTVPRPRPVFSHGAQVVLESLTDSPTDTPPNSPLELFGCFHVSQRNTFTGRLTPEMLRNVLCTAAATAGLPTRPYAG
ncbi:uracil-DNA glycosylase [Streptomyces flaveus]|nr:uracil-DNA glycosylase [Streptomyces flaveus]